MPDETNPAAPVAGLDEILWAGFYHMGLVVADLPAAMRQLGAQFGIDFDGPTVYPVQFWTPSGEPQAAGVRVGYGVQGPPYLELIEALPGTVWRLNAQALVHHVGFSTGDVLKESGRLQGLGYRLEATGGVAGGIASFAYLVNGLGLRVELTRGRGPRSRPPG